MKSAAFFAAAASLAGSVVAYPSMDPEHGPHLDPRQDSHPFLGVPAGAARAPCPGLNTLANHGFINNNGRGISAQAVQDGFLAAFSMGRDATAPGAQNALNLCSAVAGRGKCTTFDLDQMSIPHAIEHDASLRALDHQMQWNTNANNAAFNKTVWGFTKQAYGAITHVDLGHANKARLTRINQAKAQDYPGWFRQNDGGSSTEHAFYLSTMHDTSINQDPWNPQANLKWLNYWINHERLPTAVGWRKPTVTLAGSYITSLAGRVLAAPTPAAKLKDRETVEERGLDPAMLPQALAAANPSQISAAAAQATSKVGAPPAFPNPYSQIISPEEFVSNNVSSNKYAAAIQQVFESTLSSLIGAL